MPSTPTTMPPSMLADPELAAAGRRKVEFAATRMPVLRALAAEFGRGRPLEGMRVAACLHVTTETANLCRVLVAGGAELALCGSNPLSTKDEVAAAIHHELGVPVYALHGCDRATFYRQVEGALSVRPTIVVDDGADLTATIHGRHPELLGEVVGATEVTSTGVLRARNMAADGALRNLLLAGKAFVVVGYGWCGRGVAQRARGMGARVVVVEVDPVRALEAVMDGHQVLTMAEAAAVGDVFVTVTGNRDAIRLEHLRAMRPGAVLANSGHFDLEIDVAGLRRAATAATEVRPGAVAYTLPDGKDLIVLADGRLVGQSCAEASPAEVMDLTFSTMALAVEHLARDGAALGPGVHAVPAHLDDRVARLKLAALGVRCDQLTAAQHDYLG